MRGPDTRRALCGTDLSDPAPLCILLGPLIGTDVAFLTGEDGDVDVLLASPPGELMGGGDIETCGRCESPTIGLSAGSISDNNEYDGKPEFCSSSTRSFSCSVKVDANSRCCWSTSAVKLSSMDEYRGKELWRCERWSS